MLFLLKRGRYYMTFTHLYISRYSIEASREEQAEEAVTSTKVICMVLFVNPTKYS